MSEILKGSSKRVLRQKCCGASKTGEKRYVKHLGSDVSRLRSVLQCEGRFKRSYMNMLHKGRHEVQEGERLVWEQWE